MKNLYLDIAAYSDRNLDKNGVYVCAEPRIGHILLIGYAFDNDKPKVINLMKGEPIPRELISALDDPGVDKITYDARFARVFLSGHLFSKVGEFLLPFNWLCLKTWAEYLGYPKTLQGVMDVLNIHAPCPNLRALIEQAITNVLDNSRGSASIATSEEITSKLNVLAGCMKRSIEANRELHHRLSLMPMSHFEWIHYWVSEHSSDLGIRVDEIFLINAGLMARRLEENQWDQFCQLTGLHVGCGVQTFRRWLAEHGVTAPSLSQEALAKLLKETSGDVHQALMLWRDITCNPDRKYTALVNHVCSDSKVRGLLLPNGGRLGEFRFPFFQADCMPVCSIENDEEVRKHIVEGDFKWIETNFESPAVVLARMLSTAFIPSEKKRFAAFNIQRLIPSVLHWLANVNLRACAACVGESAFQAESPLAGEYFPTRTYTSDDPAVCRLYLDVENAIRDCLTTQCAVDMSMLRFTVDKDKLTIRLPSEHILTYHQPLIRVDTAGFSAIRVMGLSSEGKWDFHLMAGRDFVSDIVRAVARDIIMFAMFSAEAYDASVCLPFRDGILMEIGKNESLITAMEHVRKLPFWADSLNAVVNGYICEHYFKRSPRLISRAKGGAHDA